MILRPKSLLGRTVITNAVTLILFTIIFMSATFYFIMIPMAQRYSDDFAAVVGRLIAEDGLLDDEALLEAI